MNKGPLHRLGRPLAIAALLSGCVMVGPPAGAQPVASAGAEIAGPLAISTTGRSGAIRISGRAPGSAFTTRAELERQLAYHAAILTLKRGGVWFEIAGGAPLKPDATVRRSFDYRQWTPAWRYQLGKAWADGSPETIGPKTVTAFEVSNTITIHKGPFNAANPRAFLALSLRDNLMAVLQTPPPGPGGAPTW